MQWGLAAWHSGHRLVPLGRPGPKGSGHKCPSPGCSLLAAPPALLPPLHSFQLPADTIILQPSQPTLQTPRHSMQYPTLSSCLTLEPFLLRLQSSTKTRGMDLGFSHYRRLYRWISIISHYILVLLCSFLVTVTVGTVVIMIRASFQDRTGRVNSGYREVESQ